jgi:hypothetical protein
MWSGRRRPKRSEQGEKKLFSEKIYQGDETGQEEGLIPTYSMMHGRAGGRGGQHNRAKLLRKGKLVKKGGGLIQG